MALGSAPDADAQLLPRPLLNADFLQAHGTVGWLHGAPGWRRGCHHRGEGRGGDCAGPLSVRLPLPPAPGLTGVGGWECWLAPAYLHAGRRRVPPDHHPQLLGAGEQGAHGLLVRGLLQRNAVHLQDPVAHAQPTAGGQAPGNDLRGQPRGGWRCRGSPERRCFETNGCGAPGGEWRELQKPQGMGALGPPSSRATLD